MLIASKIKMEGYKTRRLPVVRDIREYEPFFGVIPNVMPRLQTGEEKSQKVDSPRLPINVSRLEQVRLGRFGEKGDRNELRNTYVHVAI
jgi:hypothetical protein